MALLLVSLAESTAADRPSLNEVHRLMGSHFAKLKDYKPADLISQEDVNPIFQELADEGWEVSDQKQFLKDMLPENHALVRLMRTKQGRKFMRKISHMPRVYDRLDRIVQEPDGTALVHKIILLPDGEKYVGARPSAGTPTMSDLLLISERGSAHKRQLKDFEKPTGKHYTADDFWKRLQKSYRNDVQP